VRQVNFWQVDPKEKFLKGLVHVKVLELELLRSRRAEKLLHRIEYHWHLWNVVIEHKKIHI